MTNTKTLLFAAAALASAAAIQTANADIVSYSSQAAFDEATHALQTQTFSALAADLGVGVEGAAGLSGAVNSATYPGAILPGLSISVMTNLGFEVLGPNYGGTGFATYSVASFNLGGLDFTLSPGVTAFSIDALELPTPANETLDVYSSAPTSTSTTFLGAFALFAPSTGAGAFFGLTSSDGDVIGSVDLISPEFPAVDQVQIGSAVPEPSTWAMMLLGFAGLGFAGYRTSRRTAAAA